MDAIQRLRGSRKVKKVEKSNVRKPSETIGNLRKPLETLRKPSESLRNPWKPSETFENLQKRVEKMKFGTKWVKFWSPELSTGQGESARSGDLENQAFGEFSKKIEGKLDFPPGLASAWRA